MGASIVSRTPCVSFRAALVQDLVLTLLPSILAKIKRVEGLIKSLLLDDDLAASASVSFLECQPDFKVSLDHGFSGAG